MRPLLAPSLGLAIVVAGCGNHGKAHDMAGSHDLAISHADLASTPQDLAGADLSLVDLATPPDLGPNDMGTVSGDRGHAGAGVLSGAVTAKSAHYSVTMSVGPQPTGNASSTSNQVRTGVVGATQKK